MPSKPQTLLHLIDHQSTAYLGAVAADGFPQIKAMLAPRRHEGLKVFYLTTNTSSRHVAQFRANPQACLYFCDQRYFRGLMLEVFIEVLEDSASKELIWQDGDTLYYPQGVTDPDYCVLRFTAQKGRYYSNFHSSDISLE